MEEGSENATPMNTLHWGKNCHRPGYPEVDANLENPSFGNILSVYTHPYTSSLIQRGSKWKGSTIVSIINSSLEADDVQKSTGNELELDARRSSSVVKY
jgi:hypothetical protein